ncbi:hypothetical protein BASA50_003860 [Batrachochytrium salamandrivorans]|uniref:Uncharacterized protein n=1 Tax=Batrachochytrium salamandrivorans TaxID=1357716 RepID=A0ABQ8FH81_9FUNG|nr:hypothetical protein BASA60_011409 [Batrachochytrium salamandrivorans]KAH6579676.1 hypothetical protein BASA61_010108 [Batrachochytrium salamandrivorans]KAH6598246.1 hypothetical protein BASA50_003860 [Batrachochytrium salamandrivorans]
MKLISFAVISFLAITVSAHPYQGADDQGLEESQGASSQSEQEYQITTTEDLEESQDASSQSEQQPQNTVVQALWGQYRRLLQDALVRLNESYKDKHAEVNSLHDKISTMKKEMSGIVSRTGDLNGLERVNPLQVFFALNKSLAIARTFRNALGLELQTIRAERQSLVEEIVSWDEAHK